MRTAAALVLTTALASLALASDFDPYRPAEDLADHPWIARSGVGRLFDANFEGGSLESYFTELGEAFPGVSLVVDPDAARVLVPDVRLRNVPLQSIATLPERIVSGVDVTFGGGGPVVYTDGTEERTGLVLAVQVDTAQVDSWVPESIAAIDIPTFDVDFDGGTLAEYVELLRRLNPDISIVTAGPLEHVDLPAIRVRDSIFFDVLQLAKLLAEPSGSISMEAVSADILVIRAADHEHQEHEEVVTRFWSLESVIVVHGLPLEDVLSAVETMLELFDGGDTRVRYHDQTSVLLARGPEREIEAIQEVVERLERTAIDRHNQYENLRKLERERDRGRSEVSLQAAVLEKAERDLDRVVKLFEQEFAPESEVESARLQIAERRHELDRAMADLEAKESELEELRSRLER
ncbi:MAG: hypothetical protein AAGD00_10515 [Planctomycetota bacterium]